MNTFHNARHIVLTGGFGFIGSNMIRFLNAKGISPYVIEKGPPGDKWRNVVGLSFHLVEEPPYPGLPCTIIHLGADVDTTAPMTDDLWRNNVDYSLKLLETRRDYCGPIPRFIYASSAAIYGNEERDFIERVDGLTPMNAYAFSKQQLDNLLRDKPNVYGLRFFNVYGNGEEHKGNMKSLVSRALDVPKDGIFDIFKTGRADIPDGEQARDFIHVDDVCEVIWHFIETEDDSGGLFNVGSGVVTSFNDIALSLGFVYRYIDMPASVKDQYQFHTCADLTKLRAHGYDKPFLTVPEGIARMKEIR